MEEPVEYNAGKKQEIMIYIGIVDKKALIMKRSEAIRKIGVDLMLCDLSTMDNKEIAEIALNALLEE